MIFKNKKVIIFDMDGTLIDSIGVWNDIDRALIKLIGGSDFETVDVQARRDTMLRRFNEEKDPYREYCAYLGKIYGSELSPEEIMKLRYETSDKFLIEHIDYKPRADELIKRLKKLGFTLAIASTTRESSMNIYRTKNPNIMSKAPLEEYFSVIYSKSDARRTKPDPEIYLRVMSDFEVEPGECLIFEDSLIGAEAAKSSGAETAVMYDKYSDPDREKLNELADYKFSDYSEVITELESEL